MMIFRDDLPASFRFGKGRRALKDSGSGRGLIPFIDQNCIHAVLICRLRRKRGSALPPKCFAFRRDILSRIPFLNQTEKHI
jgi:hypothetical protein